MPGNPLQPGKQAYYPALDSSVSATVRQAFRRAFDNIYKIAGQLLSTGVYAHGNATVQIPVAPEVANVPGCQITLARAGLWSITGAFTIDVKDAGDVGSLFTGSLFVSGLVAAAPASQINKPSVTQPGAALLKVQAQPQIVTIAQTWQVNVDVNATAKLQIQKDTGSGTSLADGKNSSITAIWIGFQS